MTASDVLARIDEILREYPYLEKDDIQAALAYAAWRSDEIELPAQGIMTILAAFPLRFIALGELGR
jgi:hypothetical protein